MANFAESINKLLTKVQRMDRRIKQLEYDKRVADRESELGAYDQSSESEFFYRGFDIQTLEVTSIVNSVTVFGLLQVPTSDTTSPFAQFTEDTDYTDGVTVSIPPGVMLPAVNDIISINFTGTFNSTVPIARFIPLGAGPSDYRATVTSILDDTIIVNFLTWTGSVALADVSVAKAQEAQMSLWDGVTKDGVTYTRVSATERTASSTAGDANETLIPPYSTEAPGNEIFVFLPAGGTGVTSVVYQERGPRLWRADA